MSLTVHHLTKSRSHRVLLLLEELEEDYEMVVHERNAAGRAPDSLKAVHPLGKAPVVDHDGTVLAESGAILEHLAESLADGRLAVPRDDADYAEYRFFLHYAEGSVMLPLLVKLLTNRVRTAKLPFFVKPIAKGVVGKIDERYTDGEIDLHAGFLDAHFAEREWTCAGRLTAADMQLSFPAYALVERGQVEAPNLRRWLERMKALPAWQRAVDKGGPVL